MILLMNGSREGCSYQINDRRMWKWYATTAGINIVWTLWWITDVTRNILWKEQNWTCKSCAIFVEALVKKIIMDRQVNAVFFILLATIWSGICYCILEFFVPVFTREVLTDTKRINVIITSKRTFRRRFGSNDRPIISKLCITWINGFQLNYGCEYSADITNRTM